MILIREGADVFNTKLEERHEERGDGGDSALEDASMVLEFLPHLFLSISTIVSWLWFVFRFYEFNNCNPLPFGK